MGECLGEVGVEGGLLLLPQLGLTGFPGAGERRKGKEQGLSSYPVPEALHTLAHLILTATPKGGLLSSFCKGQK